MVGFICFFIEEHLWFGCGAPFVVKSTPNCQDIFLNNFLLRLPVARRAPPKLTEENEGNEGRKFESSFSSRLTVKITKPLFCSLASLKILMSSDCLLTEENSESFREQAKVKRALLKAKIESSFSSLASVKTPCNAPAL